MYASEEFGALATWCRGVVDRLATDVGEEGRERMRRAFLTCSAYELEFWQTAADRRPA
jgi:thiaminase/transcriptional activator TenA